MRRLPTLLLTLTLLNSVSAAATSDGDFVSGAAAAHTNARVIDGDTIDIGGERIRLWGIDAPEGAQLCQRDGRNWRCGDDATLALKALLVGHTVLCAPMELDRYARTVSICLAGRHDIGSAMVRHGWALDYTKYSKGAYATEQLEAQQARRGLWSSSFIAPWEWRAQQRGER
jgi:endonuclease YncB( thermonuclease family)